MSESHRSAGNVRRAALDYLAAHHVVTIATPEPWAAAVFYVNEGFTLYFVSSPRSRHAGHFGRDTRVAATIQEDYSDWRAIKGIQLEGNVREVETTRVAAVRALYAAKFPVIADSAPGMRAVAEALARIHWYELRPAALYFIDNARGFGHRDVVELA
ncbi:MAG TPA: pyridoxamine 5'-phosphate oxidase family protein [Casimicrobiaceae bacterium]|nr:pyridoxamine 5'-phosphate oxidase family protein [Casimicrobiaceae bacterium]